MNGKILDRIVFFLLGGSLFLFLLYRMNVGELAQRLSALNFSWLALLMFYTLLWRFCHALAFRVLCGLPGTKLGAYVVTQIFSNTVSDLFFVGNTGGEVYRAYKMTSYYPQHRGIFVGMTLMYNIYYAFAMMFVFSTSGLILLFCWKLPLFLKVFLIGMTLIFFLVGCFLLHWQSHGILFQCVWFMEKLFGRKKRGFFRRLMIKVLPIDRSVKDFHKKEPRRTLFFLILMYISRMLTIGEFVIIGRVMGISIGFPEAVLINMVDSFVRIAFFLVPNGQIGVIEAAMTSLGGVVGQSSTVMFGFAIVQRMRVLFWDGVGLSLMFWEKLRGNLYGTPASNA